MRKRCPSGNEFVHIRKELPRLRDSDERAKRAISAYLGITNNKYVCMYVCDRVCESDSGSDLNKMLHTSSSALNFDCVRLWTKLLKSFQNGGDVKYLFWNDMYWTANYFFKPIIYIYTRGKLVKICANLIILVLSILTVTIREPIRQ